MPFDFDAIIIGTGFGAVVTATELALVKKKTNILMLERGPWWFTPERPLPPYIQQHPEERVQYWPRPDHRRGAVDLLSMVRSNNDAIEFFRRLTPLPEPLYR